MIRYDSTTDEQLREIIEAWSRIEELPGYAMKRHGFGDSNGGFGITYPEDLDEYQREVEKVTIPAGMVQAYGYWGPPQGYEFLVAEARYLSVLAKILIEKGLANEAACVTEYAALRA